MTVPDDVRAGTACPWCRRRSEVADDGVTRLPVHERGCLLAPPSRTVEMPEVRR